jgi:hypothetical protein
MTVICKAMTEEQHFALISNYLYIRMQHLATAEQNEENSFVDINKR